MVYLSLDGLLACLSLSLDGLLACLSLSLDGLLACLSLSLDGSVDSSHVSLSRDGSDDVSLSTDSSHVSLSLDGSDDDLSRWHLACLSISRRLRWISLSMAQMMFPPDCSDDDLSRRVR
ncbi:hypothetical protein Bca4012_008127 [Brassica carinata]